MEDGIDILGRSAVMYFMRNMDPLPGRADADANYAEGIEPARDRRDPLRGKEITHREKRIPKAHSAGITLADHPKVAWGPIDEPSDRPALQFEPTFPLSERSDALSGLASEQSEQTRLSLQHGIPYGSGASGITNAVLYLLHGLNAADAGIDIPHAMLGVMMALVYDGGHSLHEVLWTLNQSRSTLGHDVLRGHQAFEPDPAKFRSDYRAYFDGFGHTPQTALMLRAATSRAFATMLDVRRRYVAADPFA
jgi:hypothetical protein